MKTFLWFSVANVVLWHLIHGKSTLVLIKIWSLCDTTLIPRLWWRHQMETCSVLLALCTGNSPVTSEFPSQKPVTQSFDVFFDLHLNNRLSKQSRGWWFETPSRALWRHCNALSKATMIQFSDAYMRYCVTHPPLQWCHNERDGVSSPVSPLFDQPLVQAQIKENINAPRHWPLCQ